MRTYMHAYTSQNADEIKKYLMSRGVEVREHEPEFPDDDHDRHHDRYHDPED